MLSYSLPTHRLKSHTNPRICRQKNAITSPTQISFFKLYTFGSYAFLPRDILSLEENGYTFDTDENDQTIIDVNPSTFPPMPSFYCDFYSGRDTTKTEELGDGSDLLRRVFIPATDAIQIGQELELKVVQQKSGRKRGQPELTLTVMVKFLTVGMYFNEKMEYISNDKVGLVEFQLINQEFSYSPIVFITPLRKRKRFIFHDGEELEENDYKKLSLKP